VTWLCRHLLAGTRSANPNAWLLSDSTMSLSKSPALAALAERDRVKAKVRHLVRRKQQEIERAARLLRAHFVNRRTRSPKRGTLHREMLVGSFDQRNGDPERDKGE
jgi:hypothetical protein